MKKVLVGQNGDKVLRGASGRYVAKNKARAMDFGDKVLIINSKNDEEKFAKEFGKEYEVRELAKEDFTLNAKKLSDIR